MEIIRIACIVGARPDFIKMASIITELRRHPAFEPELIHTGQDFPPEVSGSFFRELEMPGPDTSLGVGGGTEIEQTAEIMRRLEPVFASSHPDIALVAGDANSTLAAALVAARMGIPIAHVEAGLRSFDRTMPEEINRVLTDAISDYLFTTEDSAEKNLLAEGIPESKIFFAGNVSIDTLLRFREKAAQSDVLERLGLETNGYAVVTMHRPSNVDDVQKLKAWLETFSKLSSVLPVVFPVHPRTRAKMETAGSTAKDVLLTPPMGYLDFMRLMSGARLVPADSSGIQDETTILQVPCLTLRANTERPVTIEQGTNLLAGVDPNVILKIARELIGAPRPQARAPKLWDGRASSRIVDVLYESRLGQPAAIRS